MSKRTAEAVKAIRAAWERERNLVSNGQGTRDWTLEQQEAILDPERGKAYDDDGKAFQGQHMKSVEKYPDYQDDPDNIQFLTRKEHLEAHKGSWQNPTNWYYDPVDKHFFDFGEGAPIPCTVIDLSHPVICIDNWDSNAVINEVSQEKKPPSSGTDPPIKDPMQPIEPNTSIRTFTANFDTNPVSKRNGFSKFIAGVRKTAKHIWDNHKGEIIGIAVTVGTFIWEAVTSSKSNSEDGSIPNFDSSTKPSTSSDEYDPYSVVEDDGFESSDGTDDSVEDEFPKEKRKSPKPHTVTEHGQHYWEGGKRVWRDKASYQRGEDKSEE